MEFEKQSENAVLIKLTQQDVESAIRQFICTCHEEYSTGWLIDPTHPLTNAEFHATKD